MPLHANDSLQTPDLRHRVSSHVRYVFMDKGTKFRYRASEMRREQSEPTATVYTAKPPLGRWTLPDPG